MLTVDQAIDTEYAGVFGNAGSCSVTRVRTILKQGVGLLNLAIDDAADVTILLDFEEVVLPVNGDRSGTDVIIDNGIDCVGYDHLASSGTVTLGNATSNVDLGTNPSIGPALTIFNADAVGGTFMPKNACICSCTCSVRDSSDNR